MARSIRDPTHPALDADPTADNRERNVDAEPEQGDCRERAEWNGAGGTETDEEEIQEMEEGEEDTFRRPASVYSTKSSTWMSKRRAEKRRLTKGTRARYR